MVYEPKYKHLRFTGYFEYPSDWQIIWSITKFIYKEIKQIIENKINIPINTI